MRLLILMMLLMAQNSYAKDLYLLDPEKVGIDYFQYQALHDPYLQPDDSTIVAGANFKIDLDILKYKGYGLAWENDLHFDQDYNGQIRGAGWHYKLNLTVLKINEDRTTIKLFKEHHSQHILERERAEHFPVYDRIGVSLIWNRDSK